MGTPWYPEEKSEVAACHYVKIAEGSVKSPLVRAKVRIYLQNEGIDLIVFHPAMDEEAFADGDPHPKDDPDFHSEVVRLLVAAKKLPARKRYELATAESGAQLPSRSVFEDVQSGGKSVMKKLYEACGVTFAS